MASVVLMCWPPDAVPLPGADLVELQFCPRCSGILPCCSCCCYNCVATLDSAIFQFFESVLGLIADLGLAWSWDFTQLVVSVELQDLSHGVQPVCSILDAAAGHGLIAGSPYPEGGLCAAPGAGGFLSVCLEVHRPIGCCWPCDLMDALSLNIAELSDSWSAMLFADLEFSLLFLAAWKWVGLAVGTTLLATDLI
ncbi:hypothetical protein Nepgr_023085 [Nepenthes gracilis]|uniref:Uncharacterized protein n=1 Tax=Nepenthes gracilis TaxID=150966 RepID=A0AAD3T025_NEPGR|nr:hypothetical protein Nepgr_023085 [Nepenthes gracilis]